ncbi:MAG TPA: single-stranded-DNA-specific exonuclease RecJ [Oscillospiraceae bacterium]|nr:single-stranded-DNA-specific exonuclease RecJ [Oscillospiraceae bacterium]
MNIKKWAVLPLNKDNAVAIAEKFSIPSFLAMLLEIRGIREQEQIENLFRSDINFSDPLIMADMQKAVTRIRTAIDNFEKIAVYGDYDADGVTATAMLYSYLDSCGANVLFYIPEREGEGYGLNIGAIDTLHEQQVDLIVTVDNGISSVAEVEYATSLGIDMVITDHHRPREIIPSAVAVVDPYRKDCGSSYKCFAGVGVAFQLIRALEGEECDIDGLLENYSDLVAIGTIGDIVPITGENRTFVKLGLKQISRTDRVGLRALLEQSSMAGRQLTSTNVAFTVVPRINATGRIGSPDRAVHLLICEDQEEAQELATDICDNNEFRRQIENEILEKALELLKKEPQRMYDRVMVVEGEGWHHGVIGIVASRLTDKFGKPCIVISYENGEAKGSGRSIDGFSLFDAVCACSQYFTKFGGHPMAAGLSMKAEDIPAFRAAINAYAASLPDEMPFQTLRIDCKLNPAALNVEMAETLEMLEPFGMGNPSPLFGLFQMHLDAITPVGGGKHLRLTFSRNHCTVKCMQFHTTPEEFAYRVGDVLDLAVTLDCKPYNGVNTLSVFIKDSKLSGVDIDTLLSEQRIYEKAKRLESLNEAEVRALIPTREEFAAIYRYLRAQQGWHGGITVLLFRLSIPSIGLAKLITALEVLAEHGLIQLETDETIYHITLHSVADKVDLFQSELLSSIKSLQKDGN